MSNETHMKVVRTIEPLGIKLSGAAARSVESSESHATLLYESLNRSVYRLDMALSVPNEEATGDDIAEALDAAVHVDQLIKQIMLLPERYRRFSIENRWGDWPLLGDCSSPVDAVDAPRFAADSRMAELKAAGSILPGPAFHTSECWRDAAKRGL